MKSSTLIGTLCTAALTHAWTPPALAAIVAGSLRAYGPASGGVRAAPKPTGAALLAAGLCGLAGLNTVARRRRRDVGTLGPPRLPRQARASGAISRPFAGISGLLGPLVLALALALSGCGGGDDAAAPTATSLAAAGALAANDKATSEDNTAEILAAKRGDKKKKAPKPPAPPSSPDGGTAASPTRGYVACAGSATLQFETFADGTRRIAGMSSISAPKIVDNHIDIYYQAPSSFRLDFNGFGGDSFGAADERAAQLVGYRYFVRASSEFEIGTSASGKALLGRYSDTSGICFFAAGPDPRPLMSGSGSFAGSADGIALLGGAARRLYDTSTARGTIDFDRAQIDLTLSLVGREFRNPVNPVAIGSAAGRLGFGPNGYVSGTLAGPGGSTGTVAGSFFDNGTGLGLVFELRYPNGSRIYGAAATDVGRP